MTEMKNIMLRFGKKTTVYHVYDALHNIYIYIVTFFGNLFWKFTVSEFIIHVFEVISYSAAISACEKGNRSFAIDQLSIAGCMEDTMWRSTGILMDT